MISLEPITMDLFTQYKFLSGLRRGPLGELAFLTAQAVSLIHI